MKPLLRCIAALTFSLLFVAGCGGAESDNTAEFTVDPTIGKAFDAEGVTGSIVLIPIDTDDPTPTIYDLKATRRDLAPAETYKLFATLVALEGDVLDSIDTELAWDGEGPTVPPWNRTHTLRSALETESDWFYAQIADIIGIDPLEVWLNRSGFGNANLRGSRASFWSDGTLRIDTLQQALFYADLFSDDPAFDRYTAFDVKDLMHREAGDDWTLTWFTGTDTVSQPSDVGWMVGSVATDAGSWAFALSVDLPEDAGLDLDLRKRLALDVFASQGIVGDTHQ